MRRLAPALLAAVVALLGCADSTPPTPAPAPASTTSAAAVCKNPDRTQVNQLTSPPPMLIDVSKTYTAKVNLVAGSFTIKLNHQAAPQTVNNFVYLAQQKFYDCLTFHRLVPQFVVQGGDPLGNGTGGPPYKLPNETNRLPWQIGSLGMASSAQGVSGSQFFIVLANGPGADSLATSGVYNQFGLVTSGMDVVEAIKVGDQIQSIEITAQ